MPCLAAQVAVTSGVCALQCEQGIWGPASSADPPGCITGSGKTSTAKDLFPTVVVGHALLWLSHVLPLTFIITCFIK